MSEYDEGDGMHRMPAWQTRYKMGDKNDGLVGGRLLSAITGAAAAPNQTLLNILCFQYEWILVTIYGCWMVNINIAHNILGP